MMRNNRFRFALPLALALVCATGLRAQRVEGRVSAAKDGAAVPYVNVAMLRAADSSMVRGTSTAADGTYALDADTVECFLRVSAIGYETAFAPVPTGGGRVDFALNEGATTLSEVSITAAKPLYAFDGEKKIYNVSEDPTIRNGSAQDALQNSPGVQVDGDGNITLNGKAVVVYINDRESHYTGEMLKQYIKTLTADQISSIEVMEYPPAKYGGGTPVINIRTEQNLKRNSYISFGAQGSSRPEASPFVSYAYANEKLRFDAYLRYSYDHWDSHSDGDGTYLADDSTVVRRYSHRSENLSREHDFSGSVSFGYDFDSMNTLSAYMNFGPSWSRWNSDGRTERTEWVDSLMQDYSYTSHGGDTSGFMWGYASVDFEHKFNNEGHRISFSVNGNTWGSLGTGRGFSFQHYDAQPQMSYDARTRESNQDYSLSLGADYSLPYSDKGEVGAGLSFDFGNDYNYSLRDTLGADGLFHTDALLSDSSRTPGRIASFYLSWRHKFGRFTVRLGGNFNYRVGTNRHLGLPQFDTTVRDFTFGPSVTLLYNTESMHSFSLNYRMSTSTPSPASLSRYESYSTDSYSTGNPDLDRSYSHRIGAGWDKYFEKGHSIGVNASFSAEKNEVSHISLPTYSTFFGRYVEVTKPWNAKDSREGRLSIYARWRPSAVFNLTLSADVEDSWYRTMLHPGEYFEDEMASWSTRLYARAKLFNLVWVSASGHYNSRSHGWGVLNVSEPRWGVDLSASADLFDRMLSFYVSVNDVFNTSNWNSSSINPYSLSTSNYSYNSQYITFGVTLRFGRMELSNSSQEGIQQSSGGGGGGGR